MKSNQIERIKGLYAITPDQPDTAILLSMVRQALLGGIKVLQYRNKAANSDLSRAQATALRDLTHEYSVPLIINDDVSLAQLVGADGVHLGGDDASVTSARAILGCDRIIGVSCYNRVDLAREAVHLGADYVAFGSFFSSSVKPDAVAAPIDLLCMARHELDVPLVAIGGITAENGIQLLEAGANALAVISAIFNAPDVQRAVRQFSALDFHVN